MLRVSSCKWQCEEWLPTSWRMAILKAAARRPGSQVSLGMWNMPPWSGSRFSLPRGIRKTGMLCGWILQMPNGQCQTDSLHLPGTFTSHRPMVMSYFQDLHMCLMLPNSTTIWQQLEIGITMGCSNFPILFFTAFEVMMIGARQVVGRACLPTGQKLNMQTTTSAF